MRGRPFLFVFTCFFFLFLLSDFVVLFLVINECAISTYFDIDLISFFFIPS